MRRVAVIGASGSGKTTVARTLAERLGVPHVELDALHHGPNWAEANAEELQSSVVGALEGCREGWVVDGNYQRKIGDLVVEQADTIVWLDLPLALILARLTRRTARRIARRTELWNGNRETLRNALFSRDSLFAWTIRSHGRHRREQPQRLARLAADVVHIRRPREIERWLTAQPNVSAEAVSGSRP
jgi:adenylate kinase family enzyme